MGSRGPGRGFIATAAVVLAVVIARPAASASVSNPEPAQPSVVGQSLSAAPTITEFPTPSPDLSPYAITSGPDGNLWFTYLFAFTNKIGRITTDGVANEFCLYTGNGTGITSGPDGNVWVTAPSLFANLIHVAPTGACSGLTIPFPPFNRSPQDIVTGPDGALWFTEPTGNQIGRFAFLPPPPFPDPFPPSPFTFFNVPTPGSGVSGITRGPDGALWFTEQSADRIGRITTAGAFTEYPLPSPGSSPTGITSGPDGALWFTEQNGNRIGRITTAGAITEFALPTASSSPHGITAGPDGALWFTEQFGDRIGRITTSGGITEIPLAPGSSPAGITTGPDSNIWFAEYGRHMIGRLNLATGPLIVNSTADPGDGVCDEAECTLREAIDAANAHVGIDVINFHIGPGGPQTILPAGPLPPIVDQVVLDATTQPGFAGMPLIELNGASAGPDADGLMVNNGHSTIRGLVIGGFSRNGVFVLGGEANVITGNFIGTDSSGTFPRTNNGTAGILVIGSANNMIGGATPALRNVISGNHHGVYVTGIASTGNVIVGNFIGTDVTGLHGLGNLPYHGIVLDGASNNRVGGAATGEKNVISANGFYGVQIRSGFFAPFDPATANVVQGNYIGVDTTGNAALGNGYDGVAITNTASNVVGGTSAAARNVISGNPHAGVGISQSGATGNVVQGNYIGTDVSGSLALGNGAGVDIFGAANNVVGGLSPGAGNVISANGLSGGPAANAGVAIGGTGATGNVVQGNFIGTDAAGFGALGNSMGVAISSENNLIGGSRHGARPVISGNVGPGVGLFGNTTTGNRIQGNFIGTSAYGDGPLGNDFGVFMCCGAGHNVIGGAGPGEGNTVASSRHDGISLGGACCNTIQGNYIGTNAVGASGLGNGGNGIFVNFGSANTIGGDALGARNVISGNGASGILITSNFLPNTVLGNYIGVDPTGSRALRNGQEGIHVSGGNGNVIGGTSVGAGNVISGNGSHGVSLTDSTRGNVIQQNRIGTDANGAASIRNNNNGIVLASAIDSLVGGAASNAGNLISGNGTNGVLLTAATTRTTIAGNLIGIDAAGTAALPNVFAGIAVSGGSTATEIGGTSTAARNVISGNAQGGINIHSGGGTLVEGNFVGTNAAGTTSVPNSTNGIIIASGGTTIGGTTAGSRNVISGNQFNGVLLDGPGATGTIVQGNNIGLNAAGTVALGNGSIGIRIDGASNALVGGTTPGTANVVMFNAGAGVSVVSRQGAATGIAIEGNSIASNGGLGIDLNDDGVTPNDIRDPDTGPNALQNYPVVTSAQSLGTVGTIRGRLNSTANTSFRVEVFASSSCDPSGFGEGQTFLGSTTVTTNPGGSAPFAIDAAFGPGVFITATATDAAGNSSEFAKCAQATGDAGQTEGDQD